MVPIDCESHLSVINNDVFNKIMMAGEHGFREYSQHVYFNNSYPERQSFSIYREGMNLKAMRFDTTNKYEIVDGNVLLNQIILSASRILKNYYLQKFNASVEQPSLLAETHPRERFRAFLYRCDVFRYREYLCTVLMEPIITISARTFQSINTLLLN